MIDEINFDEVLKNFRPQFGNENHIRVLGLIDKIQKKKILVAEKLKNQETITKKLQEIEREEKNIIFLIKQII